MFGVSADNLVADVLSASSQQTPAKRRGVETENKDIAKCVQEMKRMMSVMMKMSLSQDHYMRIMRSILLQYHRVPKDS